MKLVNLFVSIFAAAPMLAAACGVCIEDKMAATYDHAVITTAFNRGHTVVFAEMSDAPLSNADQTRKIIQAFEAAPGVDRGSVRVSFNPAAISFAVDEGKTEIRNVLNGAETALKSGVHFSLIRAVRQSQESH
jgi:hypothetical protein